MIGQAYEIWVLEDDGSLLCCLIVTMLKKKDIVSRLEM